MAKTRTLTTRSGKSFSITGTGASAKRTPVSSGSSSSSSKSLSLPVSKSVPSGGGSSSKNTTASSASTSSSTILGAPTNPKEGDQFVSEISGNTFTYKNIGGRLQPIITGRKTQQATPSSGPFSEQTAQRLREGSQEIKQNAVSIPRPSGVSAPTSLTTPGGLQILPEDQRKQQATQRAQARQEFEQGSDIPFQQAVALAAKQSPFSGFSSNELFQAIRSGQIVPSRSNPAWVSMYDIGENGVPQPTEMQRQAYEMWEQSKRTENINTQQNDTIGMLNRANATADKDKRESVKEKEFFDNLAKISTPKEDLPEVFTTSGGEDITDQLKSLDIYDQLMNSSEIRGINSKISDVEVKIAELEKAKASIENDIRKEVEGEASMSYIIALTSQRGGAINREIQFQQSKLQAYQNEMKSLKQEVSDRINLAVQDRDFTFQQQKFAQQQRQESLSNQIRIADFNLGVEKFLQDQENDRFDRAFKKVGLDMDTLIPLARSAGGSFQNAVLQSFSQSLRDIGIDAPEMDSSILSALNPDEKKEILDQLMDLSKIKDPAIRAAFIAASDLDGLISPGAIGGGKGNASGKGDGKVNFDFEQLLKDNPGITAQEAATLAESTLGTNKLNPATIASFTSAFGQESVGVLSNTFGGLTSQEIRDIERFQKNIENIDKQISDLSNEVKRGDIAPEDVPAEKARLEAEQKKWQQQIEQIEGNTPVESGFSIFNFFK